jgi:DNA-binding PadR family transcriptional regulator
MLLAHRAPARDGEDAWGRGRPRHHHREGHGPGPFGSPWSRMHGPGARGFPGHGRMARRGDVRTAILVLLAERPMHGYQVIQELEARSGGRWRPSAGSVYPTLQQLEDEGRVRSEELDGRRVFTLTDDGRTEVTRRGGPGGAPWEAMGTTGDDARADLRRLAFQVGAAAMQVAEVGSAASLAEAADILAESRRRLYRLLADEPEGEAGPASDAPRAASGTDG